MVVGSIYFPEHFTSSSESFFADHLHPLTRLLLICVDVQNQVYTVSVTVGLKLSLQRQVKAILFPADFSGQHHLFAQSPLRPIQRITPSPTPSSPPPI